MLSLNKVIEVGRSCQTLGFEGQTHDFVTHALTHWQPVEFFEYWSNVVPTAGPGHKTGSVVLHTLKSVHGTVREAGQQGVSIVKSG